MSMLLSCCCNGDLPVNNCFGCRRKPNVTSWRLAADPIAWDIPDTQVTEDSRFYEEVIGTELGPFGFPGHNDVSREIRYEQRFVDPSGITSNIILTGEPPSTGPCIWWFRKLANVHGAVRLGYWFTTGGSIGNPGTVSSAAPSAEVLSGPELLEYPDEVHPDLILPAAPSCPVGLGQPFFPQGDFICAPYQYGWSVRLVLNPDTQLATVRFSSSRFFAYTSHSFIEFDESQNQTIYGEFNGYVGGEAVEGFVATRAIASFTDSGLMTGEAPDDAIVHRPTLEYSGPFDCSKLTREGQYLAPLVLAVSEITDLGSNLTSYPTTITLTTV